jgi:hypothetical protein
LRYQQAIKELKMFSVKFSATVYDSSSEESFNGWIDPNYSMWTLFEVEDTPKEFTFDTEVEALEFIDSTIGSVEPSERGTYYAQDARMNLETGEDWSYAAHVTEL